MHWNKIAQPSVNRNCNPCDCCTLAQSITQFIWDCTVQRCRVANRFIGCNHIQTKKEEKKHLHGVTSQTKSQTIKRMCRMCGRHSKCHIKWKEKIFAKYEMSLNKFVFNVPYMKPHHDNNAWFMTFSFQVHTNRNCFSLGSLVIL